MDKSYIYFADDHISFLSNIIDADLHKHLHVQVSVSMEDNFNLIINGEEISCSGVIMNSNISHIFNGNKVQQFFLLIDKTSTFAEQIINMYLCKGKWAKLPDAIVTEIRKLVNDRFCYITNEIEYSSFLYNLYSILGLSQSYTSEKIDSRVCEVIDYLRQCKEIEVSIEVLAKKVCLSKSRISHLFKDNIGIPLSSYIVNYKLQRAYDLALQGTNITEASLKAGFDSPSHFANTSRQKLGMTPREIKKVSRFLKVSKY